MGPVLARPEIPGTGPESVPMGGKTRMKQPILSTKVELEGTRRLIQDSSFAIRDIYDAIVELVTNSDDRYQVLKIPGRIDIGLVRRRASGDPTILHVRDFADGMTSDAMKQKIGRTGGRVSGLERGIAVRGTNSRGAKDVAALGTVTYESIAGDGKLHMCRITPHFDFELFEAASPSGKERKRLGISEGTGTRVRLELNPRCRIPSPDNLRKNLGRLVALRDILADSRRQIYLKDGSRAHVQISATTLEGTDRYKKSFHIPKYPGARAKLIIRRTSEAVEPEQIRFRRGGILVKSRHAVHESTLFDRDLESDPHALKFFGRLVCDHIDYLWNEFDRRVEERADPDPANPMPILDPSRRSGLTRDHPFVKALFAEALKRLRPLVEEERERAEKSRATVESAATRKRLAKLERAVTRFMEDRASLEDELSREPGSVRGGLYKQKGYSLSPPFAKIVQGHSIHCSLRVKQSAFPEIESGATVQIACLTDEVEASRRFAPLEPTSSEADILRARWKLKGIRPTSATGFRVKVGTIEAECVVEVLESEADRYRDIDGLCFQRPSYSLPVGGKRKQIRVLAPLAWIPEPTPLEVSVDNSRFKVFGEEMLAPRENLGVAMCDLRVAAIGPDETEGIITARTGPLKAEAKLFGTRPLGDGIRIKLEDISLGDQRYRWRQNVLEVATRHPALRRYLGAPPRFEGQSEKHFRAVLAEIIAEAVCARLVDESVRNNPEEFADADWSQFYKEYNRLMASFLPNVHKIQVPGET